jgi:DNA-binding Xre family transcriptional regulator
MNSIKRLERMLVRGKITKEQYLEAIGAYEVSKRVTMNTVEGIIAYLEAEMNEAIEIHDNSKDPAQRYAMMLKAYTISELLDEIKA